MALLCFGVFICKLLLDSRYYPHFSGFASLELPRWKLIKPGWYDKIDHYVTTTKHHKLQTGCLFLETLFFIYTILHNVLTAQFHWIVMSPPIMDHPVIVKIKSESTLCAVAKHTKPTSHQNSSSFTWASISYSVYFKGLKAKLSYREQWR